MERRTIIIPDIHGCFDEFRDLLDHLEVTHTDKLIFLGDLIDRGPAAAKLIQFVRTMPNEKVLCLGNHEERFLRFLRWERSLEENPMTGIAHLQDLSSLLDDDDLSFLYSAVPYHQFSVGGYKFIAVHGGFTPLMKTLDPDSKSFVNQAIRVRYVSGGGEQVRGTGSFVRLGDEKITDKFWAEVYDGRFGFAFHGHSAFKDCELVPLWEHAASLDLGCVYGNRLAAAVVVPIADYAMCSVGYEITTTSVPARRTYSE